MATILFYLTDVEEGGETIFPLEGRYGVDLLKMTGFNYKSCATGFKVSRIPLLAVCQSADTKQQASKPGYLLMAVIQNCLCLHENA